MLSTTPSLTSWRAISVQSQSESERPPVSGRSQAILRAWLRTTGGKRRLSTTSFSVLKSLQALVEEARHPFTDMPFRQSCPTSGLGEFVALADQQDGLGSAGKAN